MAGTYGAENSDCDTPVSLINATLQYIEENIKDEIDFVIWTGDSARHDSDEKIPRDADQVLSSNRWVAERFQEVFRRSDDGSSIPVVPTFGNNDILPHNIFTAGPNKWLKSYGNIWRNFIPEEQRHGFERGGWFYVEVIPNKLAVFSLNTLYFFTQNAAVDGCDARSEPGYEHLEWLRIQLQFMRQRGMKAILMGHVAPARTDSKTVWDETCWQKYTLWLQQYRDVVVSSIYGHMNVDHFMLQDTKDIDLFEDETINSAAVRTAMEDELTIQSMNSYLKELRDEWSDLPDLPDDDEAETKSQGKKKGKKCKKGKKGKKCRKEKALHKLGGPWGERYQVSLVSPSVVPNFLPTLRVVHYNITGLGEIKETAPSLRSGTPEHIKAGYQEHDDDTTENDAESVGKEKKGKKHKKPKHPDLTVPPPPSKQSPPGPAYSPQTLTLLGYTQYFANLTAINNEPKKSGTSGDKDKEPEPRPFRYEVEYDTFTDPVYNLEDMTVLSYLKLAHKIGQYKPLKDNQVSGLRDFDHGGDTFDNDELEIEGKKGKKERQQREKNKVWLEFIRRAYVGALDDDELLSFEQASEAAASTAGQTEEEVVAHDGEL